MASPAWLTSQIAAANAALQGLGVMENVSHEAFVSHKGGFGESDHDVAVSRPALVQRKRGEIRTANGKEVSFQAVISFVAPVRIHPRDRMTLWDGITGPLVIPQGGLVDPATGDPFLRVVYLG
jgi:hypothetical protein